MKAFDKFIDLVETLCYPLCRLAGVEYKIVNKKRYKAFMFVHLVIYLLFLAFLIKLWWFT